MATACISMRDRVQRAVACACKIVRGKIDPAKMTYAKLALVKRALGAKRAHAKPQSAWYMMVLSWLSCAYDSRERVHESQGFNAPSVPQSTALMLAVSAVVVATV